MHPEAESVTVFRLVFLCRCSLDFLKNKSEWKAANVEKIIMLHLQRG